MKIGEHCDIARVSLEDWQKTARACAVEEEGVIAMITEMAKAIPDEISAARDQALVDGLSENTIAPLARQLIQHAHERLASITTVRRKRRPHSGRTRSGERFHADPKR
jgi:hypothetical protein